MAQTETLTQWKVDPYHSEIGFKARHLVISTVTGKFDSFDATVDTEGEDFSSAEIHFEADIDSINTGIEDRDAHLKSEDFFDAGNYPKLTFQSTSVEAVDDNHYKLTGDLTIRGTTKSVELDVAYGGTVKDPQGNTKAGFEVTGEINRKEFGLKWNAVTEAGNLVVADTIKLQIDVQFSRVD